MQGDITPADDDESNGSSQKVMCSNKFNKCIPFIFYLTEVDDIRTVVGILFRGIGSIVLHI